MEVLPKFSRNVVLKMSMLAARMQKMKAGNLSGMENHNKRIFKNHSNPDIDTELSNQNYDLINRDGKYKDVVKDIIDSQKISDRATRKDAVLVSEWIITSDQAFFQAMQPEERDRFFKEATDWFKERYGEQNMVYAHVHLDETTPHMHLGVVPMRDGKLQAKNVFNREELRTIQEALPNHLKEKGFKIDRGSEKSDRKHLSVPEYKEAIEATKQLESEGLKKRQEIVQAISNIDTLQSTKKALQAEYEAQRMIVSEFKKRGEGLVQATEQLADRPQYKAPAVEPIYQPKAHPDLLGKNVKIEKNDYNKMLTSQRDAVTKHEQLTKNFNTVAERLKNAYGANHTLAQELEKAKKAIPVQTNDFVPRPEHDKVQKALQLSEKNHEKKDVIIQKQKTEITDLRQQVTEFKTLCIDFIKETRHQAFDLMNALAKKLHLIKDVNVAIREDKQREEQEKQRQNAPSQVKERSDDWDMER